MIDILLSYLLFGFTWMTICDVFIQKMPNNGVRLRYLFLWPFTFGAFVIGFINAVINKWNDEDM
tara:strand:+ start:765 stop:956 length:192 start_codon:yes stop_codon:yes gene_type:complete